MPRRSYSGWKTTATGRMIHKPKERFPLESVCGVVLVDGKSTRNLGACDKCMDSKAEERGKK